MSTLQVISKLTSYDYPSCIWESGANVSQHSIPDHRAHVLINHKGCIPHFTGSKCLIVAYDSPPELIQYENNQDSSGVMSVEFVGPGSKPHLHTDTTKEVDPFLSLFFHHTGKLQLLPLLFVRE